MMKNRNPLRRFLKKVANRLVSWLDGLLDRCREPTIVGKEYVAGLDDLSGIFSSTIISVRPGKSTTCHVKLGKGVYLGRRVELEAGKIEIGDDTSLQDGCAVRGDVKIGAHCIFGHNGLVISTSHRFRDKPEWLIRDQDAAFHVRADNRASIAVQIDDDCWFGWGCTVMPGVHVGRGAVIGANSVVTKDVGPYEVHGGAPNRKIGHRLLFVPPASISALADAHIPYFYRGFRLLQEDLKQSRTDGVIFGRTAAAVILAELPLAGAILKGRLFSNHEMKMRFRLNGFDLGSHTISPGNFEIKLTITDKVAEYIREPALAHYTVLEWQTTENTAQRFGDDAPHCYGISAIELLKADDGTLSS